VQVTKKEFQAYEKVRKSGVTNMFNVTMVEFLSGLSRDKIITIMKNYKELCDKFPDVRKL
jgi:hypothetical protein